MTRTRRALVALAILATLAVSGPAADRIEEDDPRWDCTTMGNRICGDRA